MRDIRQITSTDLLALKHQYDKDFLRYWRRPMGLLNSNQFQWMHLNPDFLSLQKRA